jgi:hypothetical protein
VPLYWATAFLTAAYPRQFFTYCFDKKDGGLEVCCQAGEQTLTQGRSSGWGDAITKRWAEGLLSVAILLFLPITKQMIFCFFSPKSFSMWLILGTPTFSDFGLGTGLNHANMSLYVNNEACMPSQDLLQGIRFFRISSALRF